MLYALIVAAVVVIWLIVARTSRLNKDSRQQELAVKMLTAVEEGREERSLPGTRTVGRMAADGSFERVGPRSLEFAWREDVVPYFVTTYGTLPYRQRQTRAAHALSMIRSRLSPDEYEELKGVWCRTLPLHEARNL